MLAALPSLGNARARFAVPSNIRPMLGALSGSNVPGIAVAWIDGPQTGSVRAGNAEVGQPVDNDTLFEAASLSKPTFALGVQQLAARGALHLDRPISQIVDLHAETDDPRVLKITPRQALTHTSGLPNWRFHQEPLRCKYAPGTRFSYSGEGVFLLQRAVEHVTGTGLAAFMRTAILEPSGMWHSSFVYQHRFQRRLAAPHDALGKRAYHRTALVGEQLLRLASKRKRPLELWAWPEVRAALPLLDPPQRPLPVFSIINAASSLLTTAHDYTLVMRAIVEHRPMTVPEVDVVPGVGWGLGVGVETSADRLAFHWGDNDGFKAMMACDAGFARGAIVLTNSDAGIPVATRVLRSFYGNRHPSFSWVDEMYD